MAPEIPTNTGAHTNNKQYLWIAGVSLIAFLFILGIMHIGDTASKDRRIQSDKDIQACFDRNGVVRIGHDNWFRECTIKAP